MSSTRFSPWERATRGQAAAAAAAAANQNQQLAEFGGRVRHWQRDQIVVHGGSQEQEGAPQDKVGVPYRQLYGFKVTKWTPTDAPLAESLCKPPKGIEPIRVPFKRSRTPTFEAEDTQEKLPPRRSTRLSTTQMADMAEATEAGGPQVDVAPEGVPMDVEQNNVHLQNSDATAKATAAVEEQKKEEELTVKDGEAGTEKEGDHIRDGEQEVGGDADKPPAEVDVADVAEAPVISASPEDGKDKEEPNATTDTAEKDEPNVTSTEPKVEDKVTPEEQDMPAKEILDKPANEQQTNQTHPNDKDETK